jgi:hypothetical protein
MLRNKIIIGRRDRVDFPDLFLDDIDAKVDTGAYSCAIHCDNIKVFKRNNEAWVRFTLFDDNEKTKHEAKILIYKSIKNSFGTKEQRCLIETHIRLFEKNILIQLALTDRSSMKYPVLLGRKLLMDNFIVDVSKYNISYTKKIKSSIKNVMKKKNKKFI